ncbi:hypothetical protein HBH48_075150 [Parastagonospora nodorum]|nr:hypothetical protein HBH48_075150 [Parastagonospora nodorum]
MILLRQTRERSSRDSICDAITLISDEYETLYAEVKREIRERAILCYLLQSTAPNSRLRIITHLAMRSKRRKMRCNYNSETRLQNNNRYAKAVVYKYKDISSLNYTQFIRTLKREVEFKDKRSSIYYYTKTADSNTEEQSTTQVRSSVALPSIKRKNALRSTRELVQPEYETDARRIVRGSENSASASLLVYSNYALQECSPLNVRYVQRPADAYNKIGTHRGYSCICSELSRTATRFLSANMMALIGIVLYNAIKEYYDDGMRKTIYFYSYTVEDDYYDNDVDNILIKCIDNERQRYNTLIEDYNCAGKREDNILTVDKCRTGHSNKKDIEADEREEETRVRLRKLLGEIHDILLREFREANNFTESVTHNDDEQV